MKLGILTELKTIFVLRSVVDPSQLHRVRLDFLVNDQHICQKVHDEFLLVSALIVTYTTQRTEISKPIIWSVTATDMVVSLSRPVLATDNTSICQECAASPAKAGST